MLCFNKTKKIRDHFALPIDLVVSLQPICFKHLLNMHIFARFCFLAPILLSLLISCSTSKEKESILEMCDVKGHVASFLDTVWVADVFQGKERLLSMEGTSERRFDEDGNLILQSDYDQQGHLIWKGSWRFFKGMMVDFKSYDQNGEIQSVTNYVNDKELLREEITQFFGKEATIENRRTVYSYTNGRLDSTVSTLGTQKRKSSFRYIDSNNSYEETITGYDGATSSVTVWMDSNKRLVRRADGGDTLKIDYDKMNNIVKSKSSEVTFTYEYVFDEYHNWIKQKQYRSEENGNPVLAYIVTRRIVYRDNNPQP